MNVFPLWFLGGMLDLIVLVPDHCLSFYITNYELFYKPDTFYFISDASPAMGRNICFTFFYDAGRKHSVTY